MAEFSLFVFSLYLSRAAHLGIFCSFFAEGCKKKPIILNLRVRLANLSSSLRRLISSSSSLWRHVPSDLIFSKWCLTSSLHSTWWDTWQASSAQVKSARHFTSSQIITRTKPTGPHHPCPHPPSLALSTISHSTYKALHNLLQPPITSATSSTNTLPPPSAGRLAVPTSRLSTMGARAFNFSASKLWNSLPQHMRQSNAITTLKSQLKTHLFKLVYYLHLNTVHWLLLWCFVCF